MNWFLLAVRYVAAQRAKGAKGRQMRRAVKAQVARELACPAAPTGRAGQRSQSQPEQRSGKLAPSGRPAVGFGMGAALEKRNKP